MARRKMDNDRLRTLCEDELRKRDGTGGTSWIAFEGKVYDVSASHQWRRGIHQVVHRAGRDLTRDLKAAPHDAGPLERFSVVGRLVGREERS